MEGRGVRGSSAYHCLSIDVFSDKAVVARTSIDSAPPMKTAAEAQCNPAIAISIFLNAIIDLRPSTEHNHTNRETNQNTCWVVYVYDIVVGECV